MRNVRWHLTNFFGGFVVGNSINRLIDGDVKVSSIVIILLAVSVLVLNCIEKKED